MLTKPRSAPKASNTSMYAPNRRRRLSPLMIIGISVPVLLVLIGAGFVVAMPKLFSHAAATPAVPNPNCTLIVPANALSAKGLATPYQLFAPDAAANGPCNESNINQSAFVQGDIYDPATGQITTYSPLIIDKGTQPAVVPTAPTLPNGAVVGLWFGFNATNLTLQGTNAKTLANAKCVNGLVVKGQLSVFTQFAYCNAPAFFAGANKGIAAGLLKIPALGVSAVDGKACPSTRDYTIIDQDQSDNVQTSYIANGTQIAQGIAANMAKFPNGTSIANPSDNALVTHFIDPTLGCTPWTVPDLANNMIPMATMATDELQAAADQQAPVALVPLNDPMTLNGAAASVKKTNLYRVGVDQPPVAKNNAATNGSGTTYCQDLVNIQLPRLLLDMPTTIKATSPAPADANSLFTFLAMRAGASYTNLGCQALLNNAPDPVTTTVDGNGVVISATIKVPGAATGTGAAGTQLATGTATINANLDAGNATATMTANAPTLTNTQLTFTLMDTAGKTWFSQTQGTDDTGAATLTTAINGLQGLTVPPANWIYEVSNGTTVLGSGAVTFTGTTGAATLAAPAAAAQAAGTTPVAAATTPATGAATTPAPASVTSPAAPAAAGQVTPANAPYKGMTKKKW